MGATSKKILAKGLIYLRNVATHTGLRDTKMQGSSLVLYTSLGCAQQKEGLDRSFLGLKS